VQYPVIKTVTVSFGAATISYEYNLLPAALIEEADKALYLAKEKWRNRVEVLRDGTERNYTSAFKNLEL